MTTPTPHPEPVRNLEEAAAYERGLAKGRAQWRDIKDAPRDGTPVLLWCPLTIDRYYVSRDIAPNICIGFFGQSSDWGAQNVWCSVEAKEEQWGMGGEMTGPMTAVDCIVVNPTHFMPLPAPPEGK